MTVLSELEDKQWPEEGLEAVGRCPVCSSPERAALHGALEDRIFFSAPGRWVMFECADCGSGYLDPRPTPESIHLAYRNYFTHARPSTAPTGIQGWMRRALANGYRNARYGTKDRPATRLGVLAAAFMPTQRGVADAAMRHLPKPGPGLRLLDVGCGSGEFLEKAASAGWAVKGLDFDESAVQAARDHGLDVVHGDLASIDDAPGSFDAITMAHVIEHVHDPAQLLDQCWRLLKPGGHLWIETPNLGAEGHRRYGANWRGLEPPRHLVMFRPSALVNLLNEAGFDRMEHLPYRPLCERLFRASEAIAAGIDPYGPELPAADPEVVRKSERAAARDPDKREFITLRAWKL